MLSSRYDPQLIRKMKSVNWIYAGLIFRKCGEIQSVQGFQTREHLRSVPLSGWEPLAKNDTWSGEWNNLWIKGDFIVSPEQEGEALYAVPNIACPEILFFINGKPSGLFSQGSNIIPKQIGALHEQQIITEKATVGERFELAFECYAGHYCPGTAPYDNYGKSGPSPEQFSRAYGGIDICRMDVAVKNFVYDLKELLQIIEGLPESNSLKFEAVELLHAIYPDIVQYPDAVPEGVWREGMLRALDKTQAFFMSHKNDKMNTQFGQIGIIGHSHMDTAWLWPISETIRKCARTYANALTLMKQYPEYKFIQSSSLHLDWMRRYYPDIFEGIREMTAEGRYEPNGGSYVECDCNITSGELMIRHFLKGQAFTRKYLNYTSDSYWLPDTFGYNAAIPQILLGCGIRYFLTTKIAHNDSTLFPYDSFIWAGLDGSSVLTHFNIMHCYPDTENVLGAAARIQEKTRTDKKLISFGFGDGGGGPTYAMLESARRVTDLDGLPKTHYCTVSDFMKQLEQDWGKLPVYQGELYFEGHRGTLTHMHDIKRNNRKAELALRDMEYLNVLSGQPPCPDADELCKILLKNQFHDILPGTSLVCVHDLARQEVTDVIRTLRDYSGQYMDSLTDKKPDTLTVFNTLSFERSDYIQINNCPEIVVGAKNQHISDVFGRDILLFSHEPLDAFSSQTFSLTVGGDDDDTPFSFDGKSLETPYAVLIFNQSGQIESWKDKISGRELCRNGGRPLNSFLLAEKIPEVEDNWNFDADLFEKFVPQESLLTCELAGIGALQVRIRFTYRIGLSSTLVQDVIAYANSPRVDFQTKIDWKEKHYFLKAGFDLNLHVTKSKHEIQYGHIERATTHTTMQDIAKFEVCNHKWTDLSESRFGVAVLNDCKYGVSVHGSDIGLSLMSGGCRPDDTGDCGVHEMVYSVFPHEGPLMADTVIREAYRLNIPVLTTGGALKQAIPPFLKVSESNIIVESIKPAEFQEGAYIIRLYEAERNQTCVHLEFGCPVRRVYKTNMLEENKEVVPVQNNSLTLRLRPFEICTLLVEGSKFNR